MQITGIFQEIILIIILNINIDFYDYIGNFNSLCHNII